MASLKSNALDISGVRLNNDNLNNPPAGFTWGIIDGHLYMSINCSWIVWEFCDGGNETLKWRQKYGDSGWSGWKTLS